MIDEISKCDFCGKPAVAFLQYIVDGESQKISICSVCMKKKGVDVEIPETVFKVFGPDFSLEFDKEQLDDECVCGNSGEDIANGLAGCEKCYTHFRYLLNAVSETEQKVPIVENDHDRLQAKLTQAVEKEDYELAATLRDDLQRLEENNNVDEK
jgi:protein-arginine kinase activator protein McsA